MEFLSAILTKVLIGLLSAIGGWFVRHIQEWWKDKKQSEADDEAAKKAVDDLKNAKTQGELDEAAKKIADNA